MLTRLRAALALFGIRSGLAARAAAYDAPLLAAGALPLGQRVATAPDGHTSYPLCGRAPAPDHYHGAWACTRPSGHPGPCAAVQLAASPGEQAPHCDALVLHAPGRCLYCDARPDLQDNRQRARVAFTGDRLRPGFGRCPSETFRAAERIHQWAGNRPD